MITLCIVYFIGIFGITWYIKENWVYEDDKSSLIIWSIVWGHLITLLVTFLLMLILSIFPAKIQVHDKTDEIVALNDNFNTEGHFFLGTGNIENVSYYFFYKKTSTGGYVQDKVEVDDVVLYEIDSTTNEIPRIEWFKPEFKNKSWHLWTFVNSCDCTSANIYIPRGSIKTDYVLDLKN